MWCKPSLLWHLVKALQCSPTVHPSTSGAFLSPRTLAYPWFQSMTSLHYHFANTHLPYFSTNASIQHFGVDDIKNNNGQEKPSEGSVTELSDLDKVCRTITENRGVSKPMESALQKCGVPMSTELVDKVLERFRSQEKIAFRFFTWASHQTGYRHEHRTYNEMIDILSYTKHKSKQFAIVCDLLHLMKRSSNPQLLPIETYATVLRNYAEKNMTTVKKFANKKRGKIKANPEVNALNLLLDSLCNCSLVSEAEALYEKLKVKFKPDDKTYSVLFYGWCKLGRSDKAMKVLNEMIDVGHFPDNDMYNNLLDVFCKDGQVGEALNFFNFMKARACTQSSPTARTYGILIVALAQSERLEESLRLLGEMRNGGCLPDVATYTEIIAGFCSTGKLEEAFKLLDDMRDRGYPPDIVTYNCFMKVLCNLRNVNESLRLLDRITKAGCLPSVHTYNMLIKMFCEMGQLHMAFDMLDGMEKKGCAPDAFTYCSLIRGLFDNDRVEEACLYLRNAAKKGIRLPYEAYNSFLMELSKAGNIRMIQWLSDYMKRFYHHRMARHFQKAERWRRGGRRGR